ncbi:hypothetical protein JZ751_013814 [Albula glossodonta]|uniref:Uncharacterized protein n=1 Tax=Albula glossodonta TaxID=121402 RepID=A0A8T2NU14_9TELE|nr:hypothetical protein JZ751_013814 [Albula glossodonta]
MTQGLTDHMTARPLKGRPIRRQDDNILKVLLRCVPVTHVIFGSNQIQDSPQEEPRRFLFDGA